MDVNQILIIAIIVLLGVIIVFGVYFLIVYLHNKKSAKKMDTIFNPNNLVEEDSLMNVMDEKRNIDFKKDEREDSQKFITDNNKVNIATSKVMTREQNVNPFGVDMTKRTKDNTPIEKESNSNNKFFK